MTLRIAVLKDKGGEFVRTTSDSDDLWARIDQMQIDLDGIIERIDGCGRCSHG